jgi:hypothetical protein
MLAKLLEADAALSAQEAAVSARLQTLQDKRQSLRDVISLFRSSDAAADFPLAELAVSQLADAVGAESVTSVPAASPAPAKRQGSSRRKAVTPRRGKKTKAAAKPAGWQSYVKEGLGKGPLSELVIDVMKRRPDEVLEISDLIEEIFVDTMPQNINVRARDRVSHILSEGARNQDWYRPKPGFYSMSATASQ